MDWLSITANIAQIFGFVWTLAFGGYALHEVFSNRPGFFGRINLPKINMSIFFFLTVVILLIAILVRMMTWSPLNNLFQAQASSGLDLEAYCTSLQYTAESNNEFCFSYINLDLVCDWQYGGSGYTHHFDIPQDPNTAICYDPEGHRERGISNMTDYCSHKYEGGVSEGVLVNNVWECQMRINMTIACIWQYGIQNIQARENDQTWACYKT